jgi:hypothetical protein
MTSGKQTGTAASAELLAADQYRDHVTIILYDKAAPVAIGVGGAAAVADTGLVLREIGDNCTLHEEAARGQINIIGDGGKVSYQTGPVEIGTNGLLT